MAPFRRGKAVSLRSNADKDIGPADYPDDLCFFNWRMSRQIVECEIEAKHRRQAK